MGFAKAFGYGNITQITRPISRAQGSLWMMAAFLFTLSTILFLVKKDYWAYVAIGTSILSQLLILTVWNDARFGTIANMVIVIAGIMAITGFKFNSF
jgi:hypothetical protein